MATSPEDDYQEHLNHRGEHQATRNQITTAQYECFQRIVKESHRKTKTIGELISAGVSHVTVAYQYSVT